MKPASNKALDEEQKVFFGKLHLRVMQINQADEMLTKNQANAAVAQKPTALLLSAIAKICVVDSAEKCNMGAPLIAFTKKF